jgi:non-ribosomal peptide synthetase component F
MIAAVQHEYGLGEGDRVLFHTSPAFDVSVQEIFWPLAVGATVIVATGSAHKGARELASLIDRESVTVVEFVPVMLEALVAARDKGAITDLPSLRQVICGGAVLSRALSERFQQAFSAPLANHYGPTEVTVDASRFDCRQPFIGQSTPIGRPIEKTRIFVLNAEGERVPPGVIAEIYIASPGVARAYVNDPERTERSFVALEIDGARWRAFRTGDLGRYDRNGILYFHGRTDKQIKIRGNRVELDEVASALTSHPDVAVAAVVCGSHDTEGRRLIAYIEQDPETNRRLTPAGLRFWFTLEQRPELIERALEWERRRAQGRRRRGDGTTGAAAVERVPGVSGRPHR